jgi:hypothetical protein
MACSSRESIADVGTYYKPSQWRGKRLVYRSTDPDEPRRERVKIIRFLIVGFILLAGTWLLSFWGRISR